MALWTGLGDMADVKGGMIVAGLGVISGLDG